MQFHNMEPIKVCGLHCLVAKYSHFVMKELHQICVPDNIHVLDQKVIVQGTHEMGPHMIAFNVLAIIIGCCISGWDALEHALVVETSKAKRFCNILHRLAGAKHNHLAAQLDSSQSSCAGKTNKQLDLSMGYVIHCNQRSIRFKVARLVS
jgi:hypothetical protein